MSIFIFAGDLRQFRLAPGSLRAVPPEGKTHANLESAPQVPSSFFLGDAFLLLDKKFRGGLIIVDERLAKNDIAAREARRVKKLMGALRHLFRNSARGLTTSPRK